MLNLTRTADYLQEQLEELGFLIMSPGHGRSLPLVAFRLDPDDGHEFDEFALAHQLRERGWVVPAYTMAPHSEKMKMMRVVVREDFSKSRCDALVTDIKLALKTLTAMDAAQVEKFTKHVNDAVTQRFAHKKNKGEKGKKGNFHDNHSLQAKHDKSHPIC